jgi:hypothetical protein
MRPRRCIADMFRRTTLFALLLALLVLAATAAAGKEPIRVEVHDHRTGTTTLVQSPRYAIPLMELIGSPSATHKPQALRNGRPELIATLTWGYDENTPAQVDKVYADRAGRTWVERHHHLSDPAYVSWGRVKAGSALDVVLTAIQEPAEAPTSPIAAPAEPTREPRREAAAAESPERFDGSSFGWGAGLTGVLAVGLALVARGRRQRSVTASRNSRVSVAASS